MGSDKYAVLTFREGLLPRDKLLGLAASLTLFAGDDKATSSAGMPPFSFSCELEGFCISLLGIGVMLLTAVFLKAGFLMVEASFAMVLLIFVEPFVFKAPLDAVGVLFAEDLEKKPRIEAWFLFADALELCFLRVGGALAGVASPFFSILTMFARS